jgi:predicted Fe-Mo cluster-binding NifX family protein
VHSCAEDYQHAFEAGVDTFVVKGAPIDELIKAILEGKKEI